MNHYNKNQVDELITFTEDIINEKLHFCAIAGTHQKSCFSLCFKNSVQHCGLLHLNSNRISLQNNPVEFAYTGCFRKIAGSIKQTAHSKQQRTP